jgi:hypothetical protein
MIEVWLFSCLSQAQILFALLAAASPSLKRTLIDFKIRQGAPQGSRSGSGRERSFGMKNLVFGQKSGTYPSQQSSGNRSLRTRTAPQPGLGTATASRRRTDGKNAVEDDDSQDGIMRQDEFDVRWENPEFDDQELDTVEHVSRYEIKQ